MPKAKFNDIYEDLKKKIESHAYPYQSCCRRNTS